jgi:hypothetical protein
MSRSRRVLISIVLAGGYLLIAYVLSAAILLNTGTCEMADCEDIKTPMSAIVTVLSVAAAPFAVMLFLLARWIASPLHSHRTRVATTNGD